MVASNQAFDWSILSHIVEIRVNIRITNNSLVGQQIIRLLLDFNSCKV